MEFRQDGDNMGGGGGLASGIALGSMMSRKDDDRSSYIWAVIIFAIIFIIALVFLAVAFKDRGHDRGAGIGGDYAGLLATITAAKCADGGKQSDHDFLEIKAKLEHNEDRAQARQTQAELGALGLLLQKTASDNEMKNLEQFGDIKNQIGQLTMGVSTLLQERNNTAIINGVIQQLAMGMPCHARP